jgi:hypothetical protein
MNIPGLTAAASLYIGRGSYFGNINRSEVGAAMVIPQHDSGCTVYARSGEDAKTCAAIGHQDIATPTAGSTASSPRQIAFKVRVEWWSPRSDAPANRNVVEA